MELKNETIVFASDKLLLELRKRIENGRDLNKEMVPAKFESYKALTCSGSIPVSMPKGVLVVKDCALNSYQILSTLMTKQMVNLN